MMKTQSWEINAELQSCFRKWFKYWIQIWVRGWINSHRVAVVGKSFEVRDYKTPIKSRFLNWIKSFRSWSVNQRFNTIGSIQMVINQTQIQR